jgi:hypothetical protein
MSSVSAADCRRLRIIAYKLCVFRVVRSFYNLVLVSSFLRNTTNEVLILISIIGHRFTKPMRSKPCMTDELDAIVHFRPTRTGMRTMVEWVFEYATSSRKKASRKKGLS